MSTVSTKPLTRASSEPANFPSYTPPYTPDLSSRQDQNIQEIATQYLPNQCFEDHSEQRIINFNSERKVCDDLVRFVVSPLIFLAENRLTDDETKKLACLEAKLDRLPKEYPVTISAIRQKFNFAQLSSYNLAANLYAAKRYLNDVVHSMSQLYNKAGCFEKIEKINQQAGDFRNIIESELGKLFLTYEEKIGLNGLKALADNSLIDAFDVSEVKAEINSKVVTQQKNQAVFDCISDESEVVNMDAQLLSRLESKWDAFLQKNPCTIAEVKSKLNFAQDISNLTLANHLFQTLMTLNGLVKGLSRLYSDEKKEALIAEADKIKEKISLSLEQLKLNDEESIAIQPLRNLAMK